MIVDAPRAAPPRDQLVSSAAVDFAQIDAAMPVKTGVFGKQQGAHKQRRNVAQGR